MKYSPLQLKNTLNEFDFNFKKRFGQNFIVDENIIDLIISKSEINKNTFVIEIGPGSGALTYKLANNAQFVLCYEIDENLKPILEENLKQFNNIKIIYEDFLKTNIQKVLDQFNYDNIYIVSNLPYYITTPIIIKIIEDKINVDKIVIMVQKEVGERLMANVGTKDYNALSVLINYYYNVKKIIDVSRNVFMPKPNVDSIVVELTKNKNKPELINEDVFRRLIKDSFKYKRKTIKNNLKNYNLNTIDGILKKHNLDLTSRAEKIPVEVFVEITNELCNLNNGDINDKDN